MDIYSIERLYLSEYSKSKSVRPSAFLILNPHIQARLSIVCNSASEVDDRQVLKSTFNTLVIEECSIGVDIGRFQSTHCQNCIFH